MKRAAILLFLSSPMAHAQALTLQEFQAIVSDRTLSYANQGQAPFGIEYYGENGSVVWAPSDGDSCNTGSMVRGPGDMICLDYGGFDFCLTFYRAANGLRGIDETGIKYDIAFTEETSACFPSE